MRPAKSAKSGLYSRGLFYTRNFDPLPFRCVARRHKSLSARYLTCTPAAGRSPRSFVLAFGFLVVAPQWPSAAHAEESELVLKTTGNDAKPETKDTKSDTKDGKAKDESNGAKKDEDTAAKAPGKSESESKSEKPKSKYPPFAELLKDSKTLEGLITFHRKDDQLYAEIGPRQLDRDFIVLMTIARGIGQTPILGGYSWGFGDDAVWQFRKAGESIQLVRRNVRFTADHGSPTEKAVKVAYTDSVLFSLPIRTVSPQGGYVVDLTPVFMSDLPQIGLVLPGFSFSPSKSSWAEVSVLPKNVELNGGGHVRLERSQQYRFGARYARRHGERALFDQRAADDIVPAAVGR